MATRLPRHISFVTLCAVLATLFAVPAGASRLSVASSTGSIASLTVTHKAAIGAARGSQSGHTTLPWLHTDRTQILDSSGREVILRGFGTLTNDSVDAPITYTLNDYKRMRALGADYQSVRVMAYHLFGLDSQESDIKYIQRLDTMIALAKQVGMYSEFKLTFNADYAAFRGIRAPYTWAAVWQNKNGAQDTIIAQWQKLWNHYKNEPAVIGYDLVNEPKEGAIQLPADQFESQYLAPFYQKGIDALHRIDAKHLVFIQPPYQPGTLDYAPFTAVVNRSNIVYAAHFYPNIRNYVANSDFSTQAYQPTLQRFMSEAKRQHAPLLIEEFGTPLDLARQDDSSYTKQVASLDQAAVTLFNKNALGFTRVYFVDDSAARATIAQVKLSWAVISGTAGISGPLRTYLTNVTASPYPQVVAGSVASFQFDYKKGAFHVVYTPTFSIHKKQTQNYVLIYVPRSQHYGHGFGVKFKSGLSFAYGKSKSAKSSALRLVSHAKRSSKSEGQTFSWNDQNQTFLYSANQSSSGSSSQTLDITP